MQLISPPVGLHPLVHERKQVIFLEMLLKFYRRSAPNFWGEMTRSILSSYNMLVAEATIFTLQEGSTAAHCLGLMELERGITMGFAIDCRSDLLELQTKNPYISGNFLASKDSRSHHPRKRSPSWHQYHKYYQVADASEVKPKIGWDSWHTWLEASPPHFRREMKSWRSSFFGYRM